MRRFPTIATMMPMKLLQRLSLPSSVCDQEDKGGRGEMSIVVTVEAAAEVAAACSGGLRW